jgi:hypothetical protein
LVINDGESVNDYFARMLTNANNMSSHGERKEETVIVEKILRSMTSRFNYMVCSIGESK